MLESRKKISPVATEGFWWPYTPQTKLQAPPNGNMKHYKLVACLLSLNVKPPLHEHKAPPYKPKAPY